MEHFMSLHDSFDLCFTCSLTWLLPLPNGRRKAPLGKSELEDTVEQMEQRENEREGEKRRETVRNGEKRRDSESVLSYVEEGHWHDGEKY